jgi:acetyl esterase/lipase
VFITSCADGITNNTRQIRYWGMADGKTPATVLRFPQTPDAIELRHLRSFVAVAEELNFSRAAARLFLTQPALSRQIRALERLVGCDLLRRTTHRVELTVAGECLLGPALRLLTDLDDAVSATRSVGGELANRADALWDPVTEASADADLQEMRTAYEAVQEPFAPPPEINIRSVNAGGVPALRLSPGPDRPTAVLFLHGGGYVMGSAFGHRPLVGALAAAADTAVLVPDYRLAPEHPFPAAITDAISAYTWLLDTGTPPNQMTCVGDSAGAALVLSLLLALKQDELPLPGSAVLMCPSIDLTCASFEKPLSQGDDARMRRCGQLYLNGHPAEDPMVNPLNADLSGLPPLLIQAGTADPFYNDAKLITDHALTHGVDAQLELYPVDTHDFQVFWSFLPEAADALQQAGQFIRDTSSAGAATGPAPIAPVHRAEAETPHGG